VQAGKIPWSKFINIFVSVINANTNVGGFPLDEDPDDILFYSYLFLFIDGCKSGCEEICCW
jgi:hypothetical protein